MEKDLKKIKIALVHDFLVSFGGAERVLEVMSEMFPEAPIYTLLHDREKMHGKFENKVIYTSFLQKFPNFLRKRYRWIISFMPTAIEIFDLREFDLVISSSGAWSKGIVTKLSTTHIAYLHSPMRFVWDCNNSYLSNKKRNFFVRMFVSYLRIWDKQAAERPDHLIANSCYTQKRVAKYYRRNSQVIYPPVEALAKNIQRSENKKRKYFITVSRLSEYKNIKKVVEAFNELKLPLIVVGAGKQEKYLRNMAGDNVRIVGWQSDEKIKDYLNEARAFVFPAVDDFGIAPVEAMLQGVPVIALRAGGSVEYVEEGKTGEFFEEASSKDIQKAIKKFITQEKNYKQGDIIKQAKRFSKERFQRELTDFLCGHINE